MLRPPLLMARLLTLDLLVPLSACGVRDGAAGQTPPPLPPDQAAQATAQALAPQPRTPLLHDQAAQPTAGSGGSDGLPTPVATGELDRATWQALLGRL